ncbi:Fc.00g026790.m01.CDS01 [Cosmosporella sp. VM-42]
MYLAGAFYNFFMARASWALVVGGENPDMNELLSFAYFYESMRWSFPVFGDLENPDTKPADVRLPCETLASSLVPMLYTIGLCCPLATWLQSVIHHLNRFGQAGLFNGKLLGRCLNTMYLLELHSGADSSSLLVRFPPPTFRVISVLIPDTDGGGFSAFYARPGSTQGSESHGLSRYRPIGQVRWRNCLQKENTKPTNVEFFSESTTLSTPFAEWLGTRQVIHDWRDWFSPVEFDLELATRDHIHGTRFVFDTDNDVC